MSPMMTLVDSHQHFWQLADPGRDWPTADLAAIYRDFGPHDLAPLLQEHRVTATVLVQSMPCEDETRRMLALAERHASIAGVVGWTDLKAADAAARILKLARHPKLRGLRPMLQCLDDDWIADPALAPAAQAMSECGLRFDALVMPRHLPALAVFARRHPELPIVIDHAAKPAVGAGRDAAWRADMAQLARLPNVHCKLSGLVTEAQANWKPDDLRPYVAHVLACFGPARLMWGSDWPVLNLAADYGSWLDLSRQLLADLKTSDHAMIFGLNACRFYGLNTPIDFDVTRF